jgi:MYXO-CTERM domain-containing protein
MGTDASTHDLRPNPADSATIADAQAGRWLDGATDGERPLSGRGGCACRSGATGSRNEWIGLLAIGLVLAAGRGPRRRRSRH